MSRVSALKKVSAVADDESKMTWSDTRMDMEARRKPPPGPSQHLVVRVLELAIALLAPVLLYLALG